MTNNLTETFDALLDQTVIFSYNRLGYALRQCQWADADQKVDMSGKVCLVTGANSGLGFETSRRLAELGATVYMIARDYIRGGAARDRIVRQTGNPQVYLELADLSQMAEVRALADRFQQREARLDVLVNNAGVLLSERQQTPEGLERTFATNVLSGFLLTHLLRPALQAGAPARVIFVSSGGMYTRRLDPDNLQFEQESDRTGGSTPGMKMVFGRTTPQAPRPAALFSRETYSGLAAYAQSKRAQVILAEMLAERLEASGVAVNAMHPGWVDTPGLARSLPLFSKLMNLTLRTPEQGADTIVWLATAPDLENETGKFWFDRRPRETHKVDATKNTAEERQRFWEACVRLSGLTEEEQQYGPAVAEQR